MRVRTVALPVEHGGWGIALEPVLLGLMVEPSLAGFGLAVATIGAFLARHPLKLVAADRRKRRRFPRTVMAERFALLYGGIAALGLSVAFIASPDNTFLWPIAVAAPLAVLQLVADAKGESRALLPELAGSAAMTTVAASIALAGGRAMPVAFGLSAVLLARVVPTILYVRARLERLHGKETGTALVATAHILALGLVAWLAWLDVAPTIAVVMLSVLLLRALVGFSLGLPGTAKKIGISELVFGALTVIAVALGYMSGT